MTAATATRDPPITLTFSDNALLPALYGVHGSHLARIETALGVTVSERSGRLIVSGPAAATAIASAALRTLYRSLEAGDAGTLADVDDALRMARVPESLDVPPLRTPLRRVEPRSPAQAAYLSAMRTHALTMGIGPAGTGKTWLAVCYGVSLLSAGSVARIVLSRPAVEAGERLGFLPGDMKEKVDPYFRPIYDALRDVVPSEQLRRLLTTGTIEVAPLAFMRGRTLSDSFILLDEAQNATPMQIKMILTRLGHGSRMVVTGDPSQIDLPRDQDSGLTDALRILNSLDEVAVVLFQGGDALRHGLVARIIAAYEADGARIGTDVRSTRRRINDRRGDTRHELR